MRQAVSDPADMQMLKRDKYGNSWWTYALGGQGESRLQQIVFGLVLAVLGLAWLATVVFALAGLVTSGSAVGQVVSLVLLALAALVFLAK